MLAVIETAWRQRNESAVDEERRFDIRITKLTEERDRYSVEKPVDFAVIKQYLKYFLPHMEDLLIKQIDLIQKANFFGLHFNGAPTYGDILSANVNLVEPPKLNELFKLKMSNQE